MERTFLIDLLDRHGRRSAADRAIADRFLEFVRTHDDCLLRACVPGHVTASAWIWSADRTQCLLTHHRKLDRWLQLGGHVDGELHVHRAALREAQEESGMQHFDLVSPAGELVPLDLDVHPIPARPGEPEHLHWDVRFLFVARAGQPLVVSKESKALAWIPRVELADFVDEESVLRLERTAAQWEAQRGARALAACRVP